MTRLRILWRSRPDVTFLMKKNGRSRWNFFRGSALNTWVSRRPTAPRTLRCELSPLLAIAAMSLRLWRKCAGSLTAGESVMVSAASTGELERFADICNEYEVPYLLGELEENMTVARLAEESGSGSGAPPMVLTMAPLAEGVSFTDARLSIYGNADLFETLAPQQRPEIASENRRIFQRFLGPEARRFCGSRGSRHRAVRRIAASVRRRRVRRVHAAQIRRGREALRASGAARSRAEISIVGRRRANA